jgi:uncharacterized oligopeptide transporter (OPT) family protein
MPPPRAGAPAPPFAPPAGPWPATTQPVTTRPRPYFWLVIGGAVAAIVAAFLPWITATAAFVGSVHRNGLDGDGQITLVLGVAAVVLAVVALRGNPAPLAALVIVAGLGALIAVIGVIDYVDAKNRIGDLTAEERRLIAISIGAGLYLTIAAGIAVVVGAVFGAVSQDRPR